MHRHGHRLGVATHWRWLSQRWSDRVLATVFGSGAKCKQDLSMAGVWASVVAAPPCQDSSTVLAETRIEPVERSGLWPLGPLGIRGIAWWHIHGGDQLGLGIDRHLGLWPLRR